MERILVIAGGEWQTYLVKRIHELGYEVVNSNLYEDSPAFAYADYCEVADVLDREKNLEIAGKYQVQAVVTDESDIAVPTVAYVAESLGLPTIGRGKARLFTNKYCMRCFCQKHGLNTPAFRLCRSAEDAAAFMQELGGRIIIKPLDSQSSRGVFIVEKPEDIETHFEEARACSHDRQSVIAERYMDGTEFTVDGIVVGGRHYSLAISEKKHYAYNPNIASELFFSYENPEFDYSRLRQENDRLVELAGLPFGLTHAEYKFVDGDFYLVEIAARGGGTRISSHIVPLLTGIDNYGMLIESILGHSFAYDTEMLEAPYQRCAVLKFLDTKGNGGLVREIRGEQKVRSDPRVLELHLEFQAGESVCRATDDRSRIGFYIAWGDSRGELLDTMRRVEDTLQICYEE